MRIHYRKTAPKVKNGQVQYKNNWTKTPNIWNTRSAYPIFEKERPGKGFRHLIMKKDLYDFIEILPRWDELAIGLDAVFLAEGGDGTFGWYLDGVVAICAWERDLHWPDCSEEFYREHKELFAKLDIPCKKNGDDWYISFTENTARAFQLVNIFLHELGHHHDRMTTKRQYDCGRGEKFAEDYARQYEDEILARYQEKFRL